MEKLLFEISKGNPGAITCFLGLLNDDEPYGFTIMPVIIDNEIYGEDLYVLWSDLSKRDYGLMAHLCRTVPIDKLKLASSKQDYSGIEMVQEYIDSYEPVEEVE